MNPKIDSLFEKLKQKIENSDSLHKTECKVLNEKIDTICEIIKEENKKYKQVKKMKNFWSELDKSLRDDSVDGNHSQISKNINDDKK